MSAIWWFAFTAIPRWSRRVRTSKAASSAKTSADLIATLASGYAATGAGKLSATRPPSLSDSRISIRSLRAGSLSPILETLNPLAISLNGWRLSPWQARRKVWPDPDLHPAAALQFAALQPGVLPSPIPVLSLVATPSHLAYLFSVRLQQRRLP